MDQDLNDARSEPCDRGKKDFSGERNSKFRKPEGENGLELF